MHSRRLGGVPFRGRDAFFHRLKEGIDVHGVLSGDRDDGSPSSHRSFYKLHYLLIVLQRSFLIHYVNFVLGNHKIFHPYYFDCG